MSRHGGGGQDKGVTDSSGSRGKGSSGGQKAKKGGSGGDDQQEGTRISREQAMKIFAERAASSSPSEVGDMQRTNEEASVSVPTVTDTDGREQKVQLETRERDELAEMEGDIVRVKASGPRKNYIAYILARLGVEDPEMKKKEARSSLGSSSKSECVMGDDDGGDHADQSQTQGEMKANTLPSRQIIPSGRVVLEGCHYAIPAVVTLAELVKRLCPKAKQTVRIGRLQVPIYTINNNKGEEEEEEEEGEEQGSRGGKRGKSGKQKGSSENKGKENGDKESTNMKALGISIEITLAPT